MYYEEKTIDGVLCCRSAPDGAWEKKAEKQPEALRLANAIRCNEIGCLCSKNLAADELRRLHAANVELLEVLGRTAMWLPILAEVSGLDADTTQVEFSDFDDGRPPEKTSITQTIAIASAAIAKHGGTS